MRVWVGPSELAASPKKTFFGTEESLVACRFGAHHELHKLFFGGFRSTWLLELAQYRFEVVLQGLCLMVSHQLGPTQRVSEVPRLSMRSATHES